MKVMNSYRDSQLLESVSPEKISLYLKTNGWIKIAEKASLGSIWKLAKNPDISLLLPLNQEYSDFKQRIFEVIMILEEVEKRPKLEIIKGLTRTNDTVIKKNRGIIEVKIKSIHENKSEIKAREIGIFLKAMQDYYDTFGQLAFMNEDFQDKDIAVGKNQIISELELSLIDTFYDGSFSLVLGLGEKQITVPKNNNEALGLQATEQLINFIQDANAENLDEFQTDLFSLDKEVLNKFNNIVDCLLKLESNISFDWESTEKNKGRIVEISHEKLILAKDIIASVERIISVKESLLISSKESLYFNQSIINSRFFWWF